jgi:hypothetical protein
MRNACSLRVTEMMGPQAGGQERLFYSFNLETVVPENHLLRGIDRTMAIALSANLRMAVGRFEHFMR